MTQCRIVELHQPSEQWAKLAAEYAERLKNIAGPNLIRVHHIGSTAILGIRAKPTIDLLPEVIDIEQLDLLEAAFTGNGFQWWGEYGLPGRRFCPLNDSETGRRLANVHCYQTGSAEITRHVAFRDYLSSNRELALAYEVEKLRCQALHPNDTFAYSDAKNDWIKSIEKEALIWFDSQPSANDGKS